LSQAQLAERVGIARTTEIAIEQDKRRVSAEELYRYAELLGRPLDYFLGLGAWADLDFKPLFRRFGEDAGPDGIEQSTLFEFESACRDYLELETLNGLPDRQVPDVGEPSSQSIHDAERLAGVVRGYLGVGDESPLRDLRVLLEDGLAVRTFVAERAGRLSGASIHHDKIGGCVLVTRASVAHMRFTLAHELGHLLAHRKRDGHVDLERAGRKPPEERFADIFAAALLMPTRGVRERFTSIREASQEISDVDVLYLARAFGVSYPAMTYRLQNLRLVTPSLAEQLRAQHAASPVGPERRAREANIEQRFPDSSQWEQLPERYVFLAFRAYRNELVSTGRLAELLRTDHDDAASRFEQYLARTDGAETAPGGSDEEE